MSAQKEAGAYEPRPGDRVTVRRYVSPTAGERTLEHVHTGVLTEVTPHADGHFIRLDTVPERIFTGYQFLGAGQDGRSPASLVTEVSPAIPGEGVFGRLLTPDLAIAVDGSGSIVLVVTEPQGKLLRVITVTDVDALKSALDDARAAQHVALDAAEQAHLQGINDRRRSEGRLSRREAVEWLVSERGWTATPGLAVCAVQDLRTGEQSKEALAAGGEGMSYDGTHWRVPATPESGD